MQLMKLSESRVFCVGVAVLLCCIGSTALADATSWELNPDKVGWRQLNLQAKKFFVKATTAVDLEFVRSDCLALLTPVQGIPVPAGPDSALVKVASTALGIESVINFSMDARTGASLQFNNLESGRRVRERTYRYTDIGASVWTRRPPEKDEKAALDSWPEATADFRPYPPEALGEKIIDPTGLLYILSAAALEAPGDSIELIVFVRRQATRLLVTAVDFESAAKITDDNKAIAELLAKAGATQALRLHLEPMPLTGEENTKFEFLGLNRDIEIWLEPKTRLPLRVRGKAKIAGQVTINLIAAELLSQSAAISQRSCDSADLDKQPANDYL